MNMLPFETTRAMADHRPLICDSFAGGGGASTGIELALGRSPDLAINHNPAALALHAANHPDTLHLSENVWQVDPLDYVQGRHVGLAWFSPDCKHFSKAKGGKPVERNIRDLAWVVVMWAERVRPDVILLENVEEFREWGPLIETERGLMPDPEGRGKTFAKWVKALKRQGYRVEWREMVAADYGAPTIRKRLFLIARCDGEKIVWPAPTHFNPRRKGVDVAAELRAGRKPWRAAAEIIDWSIACPSIFDTADEVFAKHALRSVRPLADATMSRVARGVKRYVLDAARPFIVGLAHGYSGGRREYDIAEPLTTVHAGGNNQAVVAPSVIRFNTGSTGHDARDPLATVTANSFHKRPGGAAPLGVLAPHLMTMRNAGKPFNGADEPTHTVTAGGAGLSVVAPVLTYGQQGGGNRSVEDPAHTITASAKDQNALIAPTLIQTGYGERDGQAPRSLDITAPLGTVVAGSVKHALAVPTLIGCGGRAGQSRPRGVDEPAATMTAKADVCVAAAFLAQHNNDLRRDGGVNPGRPPDEPLSTITASPQQGVVSAFVSRQFGTSIGHGLDEPTHTATAEVNKSALVAPFIQKYYGTGDGQRLDDPCHAVTTKDRFGFVEGELGWPPFTEAVAARARQVADFLRAHGVWDEREFVTVVIDGDTFTVVDIGMRMLTPRELFSAQGFPPDYIIDLEHNGKPLRKSDQIACCGNSVSPPMAAALVAANCSHLTEWLEAAE